MKKLLLLLTFVFCFTACAKEPALQPGATPQPTGTTVEKPVIPDSFSPGKYPQTDVMMGAALDTANALTPVLVESLDIRKISQLENPDFNEFYIFVKLSVLNPECVYTDIFTTTEDYTQFKIKNINKLMYQLFGDEDFNRMDYKDSLPNGKYNQETDAFEFSTDFGWDLGSGYAGKYIFSEFGQYSKQVISHFELFILDESADDLDFISAGYYKLIYDVVSENGERFLRVSHFEKEEPVADFAPVDVIRDGNAIETANLLTSALIPTINTNSALDNPDFNEFQLLCQIASSSDINSCYKNIFPVVNNIFTRFKISDANRLVHQVTGNIEFDAMSFADSLPNGNYNPATQALEFSTDFGWTNTCYHTSGEITSQLSADRRQVVSRFEMFVPDPQAQAAPGTKSDGYYQLIYDIVTENGETFLRFNKIVKE